MECSSFALLTAQVWQNSLKQTNKLMPIYGLPSKLKGLLAPEISKFTKIRKFQKNLYANLKLLSDYGLIIPIKKDKEVYVCVVFIFKIGDASSKLEMLQSRESTFPFQSMH